MSKEKFEDLFKKKYKGFITNYQKGTNYETKYYSTGIIGLDIASGIGGLPRGRVIEVYGPESSGKSLMAIKAMVTAQRIYNKPSLYLDLEASTPPDWLEKLGIDLDMLTIIPADPELYAEKVFDVIYDAVKSNEYAYIVVDSVVGLVPEKELEGSVEDNTMALLARVMSRGIKQLVPFLSKTDTCVLFINQIREKPGIMYGDNTTTPGGKALKFYAAQRYRVNKKSQSNQKDGGVVLGHTVTVTCKKNKLAPPLRTAEFPVYYSRGVDDISNLVKTALNYDIIVKEGQTYTFKYADGAISERGKDAFTNAIIKNEEVKKLLYDQTLAAFFEGKEATISIEDEDIKFDAGDSE